MQIWVADTRRVSFDDLMDEVEHKLCGIPSSTETSEKDLQSIGQRQGEEMSS